MKSMKKSSLALLMAATALVICAIAFFFIEQSNAKEQANNMKKLETSAENIAKAGLKTTRAELDTLVKQAYNDTMARYDQLSATDKKGFEVDRLFYGRAENLLNARTGETIVANDYDMTQGEQPQTETVLHHVSGEQYRLETTATIGDTKTTVAQDYTLSLKVPVTKANSIYNYQYAIHATGDIAVVKGSKVVGNLATAKTSNITVDSASCQYVQRNGGYYDECYNDGNTDASPLKMRNAQSFKTYLPSFPKKDLQAFNALPVSTENLYLPIPKKDQYKEVEEDDGTIRRVKKTDAELEPLKKYYYKDGVLTMNSVTQKMFSADKPFSFNESEVHINAMNIDGINAVIDIGDTDQVVRVDTLSLTNGATLSVRGAGSLKLYVKNFAATAGTILTADDAAVETYIDGKSDVTFDEQFKAPGLLYVRNAHVTLPADGGFEGNIITGAKRLTINGGENNTSQLILAPKALVSFKNDTVFHGAVIAKKVYVEQSTLIFTKPEDQIPIPLAVEQFDEPIQLIALGVFTKK
jgi:Flp pilus assembly protein TadG